MGVAYVKRYRMEIGLFRAELPPAVLPEGYVWTRWTESLMDRHALVKYDSFRNEIDAQVFPCLGDPLGCQRLMRDIARQQRFLPSCTWLISHFNDESCELYDCATIQGIVSNSVFGAIQNVGVIPEYRGIRLGRALVLKSLEGFRSAKLSRVYLEVTARNRPAVELYRSLGFEVVRTLYKTIEPQPMLLR